ASPSIRSLRQISGALGVPPSHFFHDGETPPIEEIGRIVRKSARKILNLPTKGIVKELMTPEVGGAVDMLLVRIAPGGSSGPEFYQHKGEECGVVLRGAMELQVEEHRHLLRPGDSF